MILAVYQSPSWVSIAGDVGVVIAAIVSFSVLVGVIVKVVRILDKRREDHFAAQVVALVQPIVDKATASIQPNYRNGGHSLADVAEEVRGAKDAIGLLTVTGQARDAQVGEIRATLEVLNIRAERMEERQQEMQATAERSLAERDVMVEGMLANGAIVWDALSDLGAELPPMKMPPTKEKKS
jgi:hypothetical protein